ncbi:ABC-type glycerol-3-phosphate transport system substrate-binding protein [Paenibacillus forsythiae]|uniref:ABC-type glycerol-3-phosphate transport system substrate-binding protein n=1 Tax=Paenibacillus forsythiae TaxID=365616 RepID=A0ABU3H2K8_9BACL|nr:hypothetical protein [Paenibacillus forsythiae]MDT3425051.1 ABC-type glycerol-3-phosphate transport system substrate-binding protein [Paenibacillus forsythiae]
MSGGRRIRGYAVLAVLIALVAVLSGCGGKDANTVTVFLMGPNGAPDGMAEQLKEKLAASLGQDLKVEFNVSPIYNDQKLLLEYAGAMNDIIILPKQDMLDYGKQGSNVPLDDYFNKSNYADGVFEGGVERKSGDEQTELKQETHLYGIPVSSLKLFKDAGYTPEGLFVTIPASARNAERSVQVIRAMMK